MRSAVSCLPAPGLRSRRVPAAPGAGGPRGVDLCNMRTGVSHLPAPAEDAVHPAPADASLRVLVIDDDPTWLGLIREWLARLRRPAFAVTCADSYTSGLDGLLGGRFDACVVDYRLDRTGTGLDSAQGGATRRQRGSDAAAHRGRRGRVGRHGPAVGGGGLPGKRGADRRADRSRRPVRHRAVPRAPGLARERVPLPVRLRARSVRDRTLVRQPADDGQSGLRADARVPVGRRADGHRCRSRPVRRPRGVRRGVRRRQARRRHREAGGGVATEGRAADHRPFERSRAERARRRGLDPRGARRGRHRAAASGRRAAPGPEDGSRRPAGRRHRARLQQPADRHPRLHRDPAPRASGRAGTRRTSKRSSTPQPARPT